MRRVVLYIATSLDGYTARLDGSVDWLDPMDDVPGLGEAYEQFAASVGDLIMGRTTYDQVLGFGAWPYVGKRVHVLTHRDAETQGGVSFTSESPRNLVQRLASFPGSDIWLVGGPAIIAQFRDDDLIDEYRITTIPIILGRGIALFAETDRQDNVRLLGTTTIGSMVERRYERVRQMES